MRGISVLKNSEGEPFVMTIDLKNHDQRIESIIARLVREIAEEETERNDWSKISMKGIASAYNDDEPEYSDNDLLEINPNYGK